MQVTSTVGFSLDPGLGLNDDAEASMVSDAASLGYASAWTPSAATRDSIDRCMRWHAASGLATGVLVVPADGTSATEVGDWGRGAFERTARTFVLGVGAGRLKHAARAMRTYLAELRPMLSPGQPVYVAALGPSMLRLAGETADGVALNWCSREHASNSRELVLSAASQAGRKQPRTVEYIRCSVDADDRSARRALAKALLGYALGMPVYRAHFVRMGFEEEVAHLERWREAGTSGEDPLDSVPEDLLLSTGCYGRPGKVREQFESLAEAIDEPIVRVVLARSGDPIAVRLALTEFAPG